MSASLGRAAARLRAALLVSTLLLPAAGCRSAAPAVAPPTGATLLVGATLVSPHLAAPVADSWVLLRDGRIEAVGQGAPPSRAAGAERHDLAGRFLVPGLFDAHVHLRSVPGLVGAMEGEHPALVDAYFEQLPRSYLYHGFTTVLDLAPTDPGFLAELRRRSPGPDVLACGPPIPLAGGYPMLFLPEAVQFRVYTNALVEPGAAEPPAGVRPEEHTPEAVLDRVEAAGGLCAKTFVEDGFGTEKYWPVPGAETLTRLAAGARRRGLPLAVHANSLDSYRLAVDAGAGLLVHGLWTWDAAQEADAGAGLPAAVEGVLADVVDREVAVMPTLRVLAGYGALFEAAFLDDPALAAVLPGELIDWYRSEPGGWYGRSLLSEFQPGEQTAEAAREEFERGMSRVRRATGYLAAQGGRILFGSDTPASPSYGNPPGYNGYLELRALAAAGLPLDRLLAAATLDNARAFGVDDLYGSIEPGKVAHLLVFTADPLESVDAYDEIETVIVAGRLLDRGSLRADRAGAAVP